jgi:hypothetical protein
MPTTVRSSPSRLLNFPESGKCRPYLSIVFTARGRRSMMEVVSLKVGAAGVIPS